MSGELAPALPIDAAAVMVPDTTVMEGLPPLRASGRASRVILDFPTAEGQGFEAAQQPGVTFVMFGECCAFWGGSWWL
jgi:hypothetical protein